MFPYNKQDSLADENVDRLYGLRRAQFANAWESRLHVHPLFRCIEYSAVESCKRFVMQTILTPRPQLLQANGTARQGDNSNARCNCALGHAVEG